jgi:DNA repair protein RadC
MAKGKLITFREVELRYITPEEGLETVDGPAAAVAWVGQRIADATREHFVAVYLDAGSRVIGYQIVAIGTACDLQVTAREVFQPAIALGAVSLFVAHNHPSGEAHPSEHDLSATAHLYEAGELLGVELLDSLIFSGEKGCSIMGRVRNPA